jgi:FlaA1/EpsC-like NDP-sugar epimerase
MGATKRIMENLVFSESGETVVSTARFANVAFSDGSLLHGFSQRLLRNHPLSAPRDVRRYFVTGEESGLLCLASTVLGNAREIFFPKLGSEADMLAFPEIARRLLELNGFEPVEVDSEDEARAVAAELIAAGKWPCYFFDSDTSGEKPFEEFYSDDDDVEWDRFEDIGVIRAGELSASERRRALAFVENVTALRSLGAWKKSELVSLIGEACPELSHADTGRYLDERM